jgi:hypothetical protein
VDRFLTKLGEPVSEEQSGQAIANVLDRLHAGEMRESVLAGAVPVRSATSGWRAAIAAAVVAMVAGAMLQTVLLRPAAGSGVARPTGGEIREMDGLRVIPPAAGIEPGKVLQAGPNGGALFLQDGSQIDMSPGAELSVVRGEDGLHVRLAAGTVLVTAAKQRKGHLYVETKDCVVSVLGTVFAVSAEKSGSTVSVIEGEVKVQRGDISETLLAGQQATTSPELKPLPADTGTGWVAPERLAALQQPQTTTPPAPQPAAEASGVTLRGSVKLASSGEGIADVTVSLLPVVTRTGGRVLHDTTWHLVSPDGPAQRNKAYFFALWDGAAGPSSTPRTMTDSTGRFQFSNVAAGNYTISAEAEGYFGASSPTASGDAAAGGGIYRYWSGWHSVQVYSHHLSGLLPGETQNVTIEAQKAPPELSLTMVRAGVVTGRVRDSDGRLLVNARVSIVGGTAAGAAGAGGEGQVVATAMTNDLGEYRAYWLQPGEYRVLAEGPPGRLFAETWFPRGATSSEASTITVREGEEVRGVDVTLRPVQLDAPPRGRTPVFINPR